MRRLGDLAGERRIILRQAPRDRLRAMAFSLASAGSRPRGCDGSAFRAIPGDVDCRGAVRLADAADGVGCDRIRLGRVYNLLSA